MHNFDITFPKRVTYQVKPELRQTAVRNFKKLWAIVLVILLGIQFSIYPTQVVKADGDANTTTAISQNGITWNFSAEVTYGQFANGDYWVLGPVTITSVTPDFDGTRNGIQVNPTVFGGNSLDAQLPHFDASLAPTLPYTAETAQSILKVISRPAEEQNSGCGDSGEGGSDRNCLKTASVLTVLTQVPSNDGATWFRPSFIDSDKSLRYSTEDVDYGLLPSLSSVPGAFSHEQVSALIPGPYLDYMYIIDDQYLHPKDYMADYSAQYSNQTTAMALSLDIGNLTPAKIDAANKFIQVGIDTYWTVRNGRRYKADSTGGHGNGRAVPVVYAAALLNDADMISWLRNAPDDAFSESGMLYYSELPAGGGSKVLYGEATSDSNYWNVVATGNGFRTAKDPYKMVDGGPGPGLSYQVINSGNWKGSALALELFPEAARAWISDKLFRYADRWVNVGAWAQPDTCAPYDGSMADYGVAFGPTAGGCIQDTDPADGIGRFPNQQGYNKDGAGAGYRSGFADNMWNAYRDSVSDLLPPLISDGSPTGLLDSSTIQVTLEVDTDEAAACRYSASSAAVYLDMSAFSNTGGTAHSTVITGISPDTSYDYYVRCADGTGNTDLESYQISFLTDNSNQLSDGLMLHYTYDTEDISDNTTLDQSPSANNGTYFGNATTTSGFANEAVLLNGNGDFIAPASGFNFTGSFTLSTWIKNASTTGGNPETIMGRGTTTNVPGTTAFYLAASGNSVKFLISDGTVASTRSVTINPLNQWHHVVGVFNASSTSQYLYVDGVLVDSSTSVPFSQVNQTTSGMRTFIGVEGRTTASRYYWNGLIDDTRAWNRALSQSEVQTLYEDYLPDEEAPSITLTAPADGSKVSGSVILSASAYDNTGVAGVTFYRNGNIQIGDEDTASPYLAVLDSTALSDGTHSITAKARDAAENITISSAVNITVDNTPPDINSVIATADESSVSITFNTTEPTQARVDYGVSGYDSQTDIDEGDSYVTSHVKSIADLTPGTTYHFRVVAFDQAGNQRTGADNVFTTSSTPAEEDMDIPPTPTSIRSLTPIQTVQEPSNDPPFLPPSPSQNNPPSIPDPFLNYLRYGMTSLEVKKLQMFLNEDQDTRLGNDGPGSPGKETSFFGPKTLNAVKRFQEKYLQDVLSPWNLTKGTGYAGRTTLEKINRLIRGE